MPRTLASRLGAVVPSATLEMNSRAMALRARGVDVFAFGVGEPDFEPPRAVLDAAKAAIDRGASKYTAVTGRPELRAAICASTEQRRGYKVTPDQVCVSVGAKHALFNLALALFEPGDEVVIPAPYWVTYPEQVRLLGARAVIVETSEEDGWRMSPEQLEAALTPRTKAIVLCTPSNPTGAAYSEAEMRALLHVASRRDCWFIVDEIYADLVYDGFTHVSAARIAPGMRDRIIMVDGVSKTYAMTGWRIGWAIAPPEIIRALDTVQGQSTTNAATISQHAAEAALRGPLDDFHRMRATFQRRRDTMVDALNGVPGIACRRPEGAFYAFADVRGLYGIQHEGRPLATDVELALWLLEVAHVAAVPGSGFGAPGYLRFSYATSEERIRAGIDAVRGVVASAWFEDRTEQVRAVR